MVTKINFRSHVHLRFAILVLFLLHLSQSQPPPSTLDIILLPTPSSPPSSLPITTSLSVDFDGLEVLIPYSPSLQNPDLLALRAALPYGLSLSSVYALSSSLKSLGDLEIRSRLRNGNGNGNGNVNGSSPLLPLASLSYSTSGLTKYLWLLATPHPSLPTASPVLRFTNLSPASFSRENLAQLRKTWTVEFNGGGGDKGGGGGQWEGIRGHLLGSAKRGLGASMIWGDGDGNGNGDEGGGGGGGGGGGFWTCGCTVNGTVHSHLLNDPELELELKLEVELEQEQEQELEQELEFELEAELKPEQKPKLKTIETLENLLTGSPNPCTPCLPSLLALSSHLPGLLQLSTSSQSSVESVGLATLRPGETISSPHTDRLAASGVTLGGFRVIDRGGEILSERRDGADAFQNMVGGNSIRAVVRRDDHYGGGAQHGLVRASLNAVNAGKNRQSMIPREIIEDIEGFASENIRHMMHAFSSAADTTNNNVPNIPNLRYLEVGTFKGSTLLSVLGGGNSRFVSRAVAVDNFAEFETAETKGSNKITLLRNLENFIPDERWRGNNFTFVESDCWDEEKVRRAMGKETVENKFNFYFYDGPHSEEDHEMALGKYKDLLDDEVIVVVDDFNQRRVRDGTRKGILNHMGDYEILAEIVVESRWNGDVGGWWDGEGIFVLKKVYYDDGRRTKEEILMNNLQMMSIENDQMDSSSSTRMSSSESKGGTRGELQIYVVD